MKQKVENKLESVVNPKSKETLGSEMRLKEVHASEHAVTVYYDREGLRPDEKKSLETEMLKSLTDLYKEDCITFISVSQDSKDVLPQPDDHSCGCGSSSGSGSGGGCGGQTDSHKPQAALKTGHAGVGPKRSIEGAKFVFAVSSGKGGVGKSTVSANLAVTLANMGHKVGLLDADIYGPSLPILMGMRNASPEGTEDKRILPLEAHGVKFMSFGLFIEESDPVVWRGPMLGGILNQFLFDVQWGELDYLIIDMPPGTGDMQLSLAQNAVFDGAFVVSTPQEVALLDSKKGLYMFDKLQVPVLGMIENMSAFVCEHGTTYHIFGKDGVKNAADELGVLFMGSIPIEVELRESADAGLPYMATKEYEGRSVWNAYKEIATKIVTTYKK